MTRKIGLTSNSLAAFCVIPESAWNAINGRVDRVIQVEPCSETISKNLATYPELLIVCHRWKDETFAGLGNQSRQLETYSVQAINDFTGLKDRLMSLGDEVTVLPDDIKQQAKNAFRNLNRSSIELSISFSALARQVENFYNINSRFDGEVISKNINAYIIWFGPFNKSSSEVMNPIGMAMGEWIAITSDLEYVASEQIDIDMPFLLGLDIDIALDSWNQILNEAKAFGEWQKEVLFRDSVKNEFPVINFFE